MKAMPKIMHENESLECPKMPINRWAKKFGGGGIGEVWGGRCPVCPYGSYATVYTTWQAGTYVFMATTLIQVLP